MISVVSLGTQRGLPSLHISTPAPEVPIININRSLWATLGILCPLSNKPCRIILEPFHVLARAVSELKVCAWGNGEKKCSSGSFGWEWVPENVGQVWKGVEEAPFFREEDEKGSGSFSKSHPCQGSTYWGPLGSYILAQIQAMMLQDLSGLYWLLEETGRKIHFIDSEERWALKGSIRFFFPARGTCSGLRRWILNPNSATYLLDWTPMEL